MSKVYLMRCRSGAHKIGRSCTPELRVDELRKQRMDIEELIWSLACNDAVTTEHALHQRFAAAYIGKIEMFNLSPDDVSWICAQTEEGLCAGYDPTSYHRFDSRWWRERRGEC